MNRKAIRIIIGLMAAASIGIIILQFTLIRSVVSMKATEFEQDVFDALKAVTDRLEEQDGGDGKTILIDTYNKPFGQYGKTGILSATNKIINTDYSISDYFKISDEPIGINISDWLQLSEFNQ